MGGCAGEDDATPVAGSGVSKRVTDSMLACVKTAATTEKIDKCLR